MSKCPDHTPVNKITQPSRTKSRREFLKQAGAGSVLLSTFGLTACGGGSNGSDNSASGPKSVLVLGAGAAGLTAALALKKQGHKVTILEYQNRIGGRLWSLALANGQYTELGAGHFSSGMPLIVSLVDRYDLPLLSVNDGTPRYIMNDPSMNNAWQANSEDLTSYPTQWGLHASERSVTVASNLINYLVSAGIELDSVLHANWPTEAAIRRFTKPNGSIYTVQEVLLAQGASQGFINLLNVHLGAPVSQGDILSGMPNLAYFFNDKGFFRIAGGNEQLAVKMADDFGRDKIFTNAQVVSIDQTGAQVKVTTLDGRIFTADKVVSTIPFKVLTDVNVQPPWSAGKSRMISGSDALQWIDGFKGVIQTVTPTWVAQGNYGWPMAATDQAWNRVMDISGNQPGTYGNAFFYVYTEPKLAQLKSITGAGKETARTQLLISQFNTTLNTASSTTGLANNLIPTNLADFPTITSIMWSGDAGETAVPWIKAALATGVQPWMRAEWSIPEGQIHFAGDFTSYKSGWVEGAIESGLRAAAEIDPKATSL